jgi:hypothetical protein
MLMAASPQRVREYFTSPDAIVRWRGAFALLAISSEGSTVAATADPSDIERWPLGGTSRSFDGWATGRPRATNRQHRFRITLLAAQRAVFDREEPQFLP